MATLSDAQVQQAMQQFTASPAFLALPEGKDRANAYTQAFNALTGSNAPMAGGGFFQGIPGQSDLETTLSRIAGTAAGGLIGSGLLAGGGAGASAANASAATEGATDGGVGAAGTAGAAGASSTPGWLNVAQKLAPVLSGAAGAQAKSDQIKNAQQLNDAEFNLQAPNTRMATAVKAALALAGPETAQWSGPGSGLKGKILNFTGGYQTPLPPTVKTLANTVMDQQLSSQMAPPLAPGGNSTLDNLLGGAATAAGVAGAFGSNPYAPKKPVQVPGQTPDVAGFGGLQ